MFYLTSLRMICDSVGPIRQTRVTPSSRVKLTTKFIYQS